VHLHPGGSDDGETVERMPEHVPDTLQAVDSPHARQDRRRVGALTPTGLEPLACAAVLQ
jgi:hypothetical protein